VFLESSRYAKVRQVDALAADGRTVSALGLRRIPPTGGEPYVVTGSDRLDLIAQRVDGDGTRWWRVADANTALDASALTAEMGAVIEIPAG
jgi:nucleoid-associated protein YgaU